MRKSARATQTFRRSFATLNQQKTNTTSLGERYDDKKRNRVAADNIITETLPLETMSASANFVTPGQQRYLRACMVCSIVMTYSVSSPFHEHPVPRPKERYRKKD